MRIAIFSDTWLPNINGVTFSILNQLKALHQDHDLFLFVPKTFSNKFEQIPESVQVFEYTGLTFPPYPGYIMSFPPIRSLRRIIKAQKFDLVHMHTPFLQAWFGALVRRVQKIPLVTTFHTHIVEYLGHLLAGYAEEKIKHILAEPTWQIIRYQYNRSDITIAPSKIMRKELEEHGVNKVIDVPNPISPLFFNTNDQHRKKQSHSFRRTFNIPLDAPLLLYVGRVAFEKRLELLLQAYKALKIKYSNLFLAIVGDGPQLNMYKDKAKKLELQDYVFTGYIHQRQLPGVYAAGTIFVSPSDTETQGLTFIEAMSQKTPVIGVNSRGVTDHVRHGKSGLLANSLDSKEFENLIEYVFQHSKETQALIEEAKAVASKYSYAGFNKRLMEAYSLAARNWKLRGMK